MRVLMLTPDSRMIDRRILQEARELRDAGHAITLLAGFDCERDEHFALDGIDVHRFAAPRGVPGKPTRLARFPALHAIVNRVWLAGLRRVVGLTPEERVIADHGARFAADVVHCHDLPVLRAGAWLARRWQVPLVFDAHEIYHEQASLPAVLRARLRRDEQELVPRCAAVITVNDFIAVELQRLHGGPLPTVIHNSVEPPPEAIVRERTGRLRARLPGNGPVVLFQGWLGRERNLDVMVRAMALVPAPTRLAIVGYGEHEAALRHLAKAEGIEDRVHLLGPIPSDDLLEHTVDAEVGLIPYLPIDLNHRLCSPNKFFEFVAAGVPVLAHDLPFFRRMAEQLGVVRCTDMADPRRVAAELISMLQPDEARRLRARCLAARPELAWARDAAVLRALYARLA